VPHFDVAGLLLDVVSDHSYIYDKLSSFKLEYIDKPDITIHMEACDHIDKPQGYMLMNDSIKWIRKPHVDEGYYIYISNRDNQILGMLDVDNKWSLAHFKYLSHGTGREFTSVSPLSEILFRIHLLFKQGIVIHAAAIEYEGKGIIFSAPSETGKTTQANLWRKHMNAKVLNGDRPAVRIMDGRPFVFGTPWSGSSPDYINSCAPVSAIVMLEQSPANSIRKLTAYEAVTCLMPRCFLPYFDQGLMDKAINNLETVIKTVPVYLLRCRPDKESVELVYQCIK